MSNPTIAIRQADGTFYPIMSGSKAGKKRLILTPAQDSQSGARIELVRGEGEAMEDPRTFGTLHVDVSSEPEGEIELILSLDELSNVTASAGLVGSLDRQELQGNLDDLLADQDSGYQEPEELSLPSLDDLEGEEEPLSPMPQSFGDDELEPYEFDADEPAEPKTDRQILDDDSLVGDGLDDLSFGMEDDASAEGGPVEAADLGDLGDLGSFDDFGATSDLASDENPEGDLENPAGFNLGEDQKSSGAFEDIQLDEDFSLPEEDFSLPTDLPSDLEIPGSTGEDTTDFSMDELSQDDGLTLEGFDDVEDLAPVQESPLGEGRKTFEKGPEGFGLDVSLETDDLSFDSMEMDSLGDLGSDLGSDLDFDSPAGDLSAGDFSLGSEGDSAGEDDFQIPDTPMESPRPNLDKTEGEKSRRKGESQATQAKVSGKVPLVVSLGTLVVLLGIFLGLLFLNMTRMTMVPPIQSLDLRGVGEALAYKAPALPADQPLPSGKDDESRRILSLEHFGTPHFYRQFPLAN